MENKRRIPTYIITLILIFSLIGCSNSNKPVTPVSTASDEINKGSTTVTYKTYSNGRFGFSLSYPDIYVNKKESDNGDGISLESSDKLHTLKIWGGYNVNNSSGSDLLAMAKDRVSHITHDYADDHVYKLEYGGGDETQIIFNELGYVDGDKVLGILISYPEEEKGKYIDIVTHMFNELTKNTTEILKRDATDMKTGNEEVSNLNEVLNVGNIFSTTLDENASTGYIWNYSIENKDLITFDSEYNQDLDSSKQDGIKRTGAGSKHTWSFKGVKQGTTKITFKYYRNWEGENSAIKTVVYTVSRVQGSFQYTPIKVG